MKKMRKNTKTPPQSKLRSNFFFPFKKRIQELSVAFLTTRALLPVKRTIERAVFNSMSKTIETQVLQSGNQKSNIAFCIVHWNAPDFLLINASQLGKLYPDCNIFVLDNRSNQKDLDTVSKSLKQFNNVTLFSAELKPWSLVKIVGLDNLFLSYSHSKGLQFLLNYSAKHQIETAVFLDQDCILNRRIDPLIQKLSSDIWLAGASDYVLVPRNYGPLGKGEKLRYASNMVHPSFMILKPSQIRQRFGDLALIEESSVIKAYQRAHGMPFQVVEPYYGISIRTAGRILFLEAKMHNEIPLLTSYSSDDIIYAWHAWFSSRTTGFSKKQTLDGLPMLWLSETRKATLEFMKQLYKKTFAELN